MIPIYSYDDIMKDLKKKVKGKVYKNGVSPYLANDLVDLDKHGGHEIYNDKSGFVNYGSDAPSKSSSQQSSASNSNTVSQPSSSQVASSSSTPASSNNGSVVSTGSVGTTSISSAAEALGIDISSNKLLGYFGLSGKVDTNSININKKNNPKNNTINENVEIPSELSGMINDDAKKLLGYFGNGDK